MKVQHALVGLTVALVLGTVTAAHAAGPPYTVAVGGSTTGMQAITFTSSGAVTFAIKNNAGTVVNMNCTEISGTGTVMKGVGVNPIASITSTTWTGCRFPWFGALNVIQNVSSNIAGTGATATAGTSDSVTGHFGNVNFGWVAASSPASCSFTVSGKLDMAFNEATQQILINETGYSGDAVLSNVGPCAGQVQAGNPFDMVAKLNVSTGGAGAINLS